MITRVLIIQTYQGREGGHRIKEQPAIAVVIVVGHMLTITDLRHINANEPSQI